MGRGSGGSGRGGRAVRSAAVRTSEIEARLRDLTDALAGFPADSSQRAEIEARMEAVQVDLVLARERAAESRQGRLSAGNSRVLARIKATYDPATYRTALRLANQYGHTGEAVRYVTLGMPAGDRRREMARLFGKDPADEAVLRALSTRG